MTKPRNVLLTLTDQQRYDTLGCTGCGIAQTPRIDELAGRGLNFSRHFVTSPVCSPSRASIFTGLQLSRHGLWRNGCTLPHHIPTFADRAARHGVQAAAFGKHHLAPIIRRATRPHHHGFDPWLIGEGDQQLIDDDYFRWLRSEHPDAFVSYLTELFTQGHDKGYASQLPEKLHLSNWCTRHAIHWLEHQRDPDRPFILYAGFFDPHHAFNPVEPYASRFNDTELPEPLFDPDAIDRRPPHYRRYGHLQKITRDPSRLDPIRRAYHAMIAHVDRCIGDLLDALNRLGLADDTTVVFSSDHGEFLGQHGLLYKGPFMLDDLLHVPLIIAPAAGETGSGQICDGLTSAVDLVATVMELLGLPDERPADTRPLISQDHQALPESERPFILAEWEDSKQAETSSIRCLRTRDHKLVHYGQTDTGELYDYANDPHECINRFGDPTHRDIQRELFHSLANAYLTHRPDTAYLGGW